MISCAVIIAGGEGNRMKESGANELKPLVKVNGKPLINYIIDSLIYNNINEIIIIEPYFYSLKNIIKKTYPNINFKFYRPRKKQNLIKNLLKIEHLIKNDFILADSDIIINEKSITIFIKNYKSLKSFVSIAAVKEPKFENNRYLEINNKTINSFNKNGIEDGIHGGFIYTFKKDVFKYLKKYEKSNNSSFGNFINYLIEKEVISANYIDDVWDVDNLQDKEKTEQLLLKKELTNELIR